MTVPTRVMSPGFRARVFDIVRQIPRGKVSTYGRIAALLGHPGVARHVGNALAACSNEELPVPWHRVVNASGKISTAGSEQQALLSAEGVRFSATGAISLAEYAWSPAFGRLDSPRKSEAKAKRSNSNSKRATSKSKTHKSKTTTKR